MKILHALVETLVETFDEPFISNDGFWTVGSIKVSTKVASKASKAIAWGRPEGVYNSILATRAASP